MHFQQADKHHCMVPVVSFLQHCPMPNPPMPLFLNCFYGAWILKSCLGLQCGIAQLRGMWSLCSNKDVQMPCLLSRGSLAAASLWMFDSGFGGRPLQWSPCNTDSVSCVGKSKGSPYWAFRECWLLWRPEQCCSCLAGVCLWNKSGAWLWIAFLQKSLCWLSKHRESFTALGERTLTSQVSDRPASSAPAHPTHGRGLWREAALAAPWLLYQQRHLYLPGFRTTFTHCGIWSGFCFVLFSSRVEEGRTDMWSSCSPPKVRALSCWHQGICGDSTYCTQKGRRTSRETKRELWRVRSLFVYVWFITSGKSFVHCRCLICPCSHHYSFVENNTCID